MSACTSVLSAQNSCRRGEGPAPPAERGSGAEAEQVLEGQLLQAHEAVVALARLVRVEVLEGGAIGEEVGDGLARSEGRLGELLDAGVLQRFLDLGVGTEREGALLEHQV